MRRRCLHVGVMLASFHPQVVGLKNLASRDLNVSLQPEPSAYQAPWSPILRFGIAASVWLVVAIVQVLLSSPPLPSPPKRQREYFHIILLQKKVLHSM